jgi:hypothetical protein
MQKIILKQQQSLKFNLFSTLKFSKQPIYSISKPFFNRNRNNRTKHRSMTTSSETLLDIPDDLSKISNPFKILDTWRNAAILKKAQKDPEVKNRIVY